jgi:hypothetical protein
MPKWRQWETTSEADWTLALERERVVRPLDELGRPTKEGVQQAMVQLGLGRSVLYKLLRRYRQRPQTSSLLPWKRGRGSEVRRLTHEREELLCPVSSQYKDYVLVLLFITYISDKYAGVPYPAITIPKGASFKDMVALKSTSDIGDQINKKIIEPLAKANKLSEMPDFNRAASQGAHAGFGR